LLNQGLNISKEESNGSKESNGIGAIYTGLYSKKTYKFLLKFKPELEQKIKTFLKFKS